MMNFMPMELVTQIKKFVARCLSFFGISVTSTRNLQKTKELANPSVTNLLTRYKVPCKSVLHIGGHYGEEAQEYFEFGVDEAVFIEGDTDSFAQLQVNISKFQNFRAIETYISDTSGEAEFYRASNSGASSSLLKPGRHSKERPDITFSEGIRVKTKTLDSLNLGKFDLVVIDVQGAELQVLSGGHKTILSASAIWIEVNSGGMYASDAGVNEILATLQKTHAPLYLNMNENYWGDALFLKKDLLPE